MLTDNAFWTHLLGIFLPTTALSLICKPKRTNYPVNTGTTVSLQSVMSQSTVLLINHQMHPTIKMLKNKQFKLWEIVFLALQSITTTDLYTLEIWLDTTAVTVQLYTKDLTLRELINKQLKSKERNWPNLTLSLVEALTCILLLIKLLMFPSLVSTTLRNKEREHSIKTCALTLLTFRMVLLSVLLIGQNLVLFQIKVQMIHLMLLTW